MRDLNNSEMSKLNKNINYLYIIPSSKKEIVYICEKHGEVKQRFDVHLKTLNCPKCNNESKNLKYNKEYILNRIEELDSKYYYEIEDKYYIVNDKIEIKCEKHGNFEQTIHNHFNLKNKCPKCSIENRTKPTENLILFLKQNKINLLKYNGSRKKSIFECEKGHNFKSTISNLKSHKCSLCSRFEILEKEKEKFIKKSKSIWGNLLKIDYETLVYNGKRKKVKMMSNLGLIEQLPDNHIKGFLPKKSTGEEIIKFILEEKGIKYIREKTFDGCKNIKKLRFDFYLPDINTCIEYNGIQHYKPIKKFGGLEGLAYQMNNDRIKSEFCKNEKIKLLVITNKDNIFEKIEKLND